ncbi:MAG: BtrH N-terminal domain-containing protein [Candidatus Hodarchaeales archaeon]
MKSISSSYIINGFTNEPGVHCTSSALRNIFEFYGFKMSEEMIFGLGSGMGLGFASFGENPTLGGRQYKFENNLCKLLDVKLNIFRTNKQEEGWQRLKEMLDRGIPAAINMDMAFLRYRDLPDDFHFGQHTIVVCGYNPEKSSVLISDTQYPDIKEISLEDLHAARNHKYNRMMDPLNFIYEFVFPHKKPDLKTVLPEAIRLNGKNLQKKNRIVRVLGVTNGLDAISKFSKSLEKWINLPEQVLQERSIEASGYISDYGTGGGLFRYLYSRFLKEAAEILNDEKLAELSDFYKNLGDRWEKVSNSLKGFSKLSSIEEGMVKIQDLLRTIKSLELQGAQKLQNYRM